MSTDAEFKVLWPYQMKPIADLERMGCPRRVPWSLVEPHERQAQRNHGQTLRRLNQRGGLDPCELVAVLEGKCWSEVNDIEAAVQRLKELLAQHLVDSKERSDG